MKTTITSTLALVLAVALGGCGKKDEKNKEEAPAATPATPAANQTAEPVTPKAPEGPPPMVAKIEAASGSTVHGTVWFSQRKNVVTIRAHIEGLTPGLHGFHIHETGDCSAPDAKSAGGHFNPTGKNHGKPDAEDHHAGDLGNIAANGKGIAEKELGSTDITLGEGDNSIAGKAVVIHADRDDMTSQPSGNAGARVGCGVIEVEKKQ